jgi:uncharacterized small protein (TIGR04563 family)
MPETDKRKQSFYFPERMLKELRHEARRLDRALSWVVRRCVKFGLPELRKHPLPNAPLDSEEADPSKTIPEP